MHRFGVMVRDGLQDSSLCIALKEHGLGVQVAPKTFSEDGIVDLWIGERVIIHYISNEHSEGVSPMIRGRLVQLAKEYPKAVVLVENSQKDSKNFSSLQELVTIILDLLLICVDSPQAAAKYIKYLVQQQDLSGSNSPSHRSISTHPFILQAVQCLPQTGRVKSHTLLSQFKSINGIARASEEELTRSVGSTSGKMIHSFFHDPLI